MSSWATAPRSRARCSSPSRSATPRSCISTAPPATGWSPRWDRARRCSPAAPSRSASTPAIATCSTQRTGRGFIEPASATGHADQRAPRGRCAGGGFPRGADDLEATAVAEIEESFDFIIVGAGSAGCVLANRLTASGEHRLLLLEAGPDSRHPWLHIPVGYGRLFTDRRFNWCYATEPQPHCHDRQVIAPRGKVLGGSSAINGLIYIRGQAADFDHWRQLGNVGWSYEDVLPYFRKAEDNVRDRHPLAEAFSQAAQQCGYPRNDDFNGATQEGAGLYQTTTRNGVRCSAAAAY